MELQIYDLNSFCQKTKYRIKTKKLSYKLCPQVDEFPWISLGKAPSQKSILKNVDCEAKPGQIMAIAGPSGAGKTTLLEILAGEIPLSRVSGHVLVNDLPMNALHFRTVSGYVTQDEVLFPLLTVEETLLYSARLRLPGELDRATARVRKLLKELDLEHVANVKVGSESKRGISGGEKCIVSIGVDLVHNPAVLLLDEPTSGLDSASAFHVAALLKSMALRQDKTIVLTIHQPGFQILELFDKILLLSNGSVLRHGSLPLLHQLLTFAGHRVPKHVNMLEFAIEAAETLAMDSDESEFEDTESRQEYENMIRTFNLNDAEEHKMCYSNSPFGEVMILGQRFSTNILRTKELFVTKVIQAVLVGFLFGTLFLNASYDPRRFKLQNQIGFFSVSIAFLLSSVTETLPIFLQERRILTRETSRGTYRISSYVISNTVVFLPYLLTTSILYSIPVYWLVGLRRELDKFIYFLLVVWMIFIMANSYVACFSALVTNYIMGMPLATSIMGYFFLFSGYFISKEDIPSYWIFMHYLSMYKYPFECFMINEYGGQKSERRCLKSEGRECLLYGDEFLMQQGLKQSQKWSHLGGFHPWI
ncbi:ABC transporter-like protein [Quillaja saponaria]|uniref:ABC transporter-like protein n=1 Tax=Quillaja saponaria TaxID=32244 RepID=A0AAD7KYT9_QUISA|nr:ABC transporter-like protein [Quillaja saponaria]